MTNCRHFNGYKPCGRSEICDSLCPHLNTPSSRILIIHLGALGAVTRSTALLPAILRKYPGCHITWVTQQPGDQILLQNPFIERVLTTSPDDLLRLSTMEFDFAFVIDKDLKASGVLNLTRADWVYGFRVEAATGAVVPANREATELWELGLSDRKKFFENKKPETQLVHEALDLGPWMRDEYVLRLSEREKLEVERRRASWSRSGQVLIGINTGCSPVIPYKKLSIQKQREMIERLSARSDVRIVLLGGKEDTIRNERIAYGLDVVQSDTERGLRDGILSVAACDIVVTGDSLGMHLAIALRKWTVAWFGPTCAHEIDLYDRGVSILTQASCSPCWKRSCDRTPMCYDLVPIDEVLKGTWDGIAKLKQDEFKNGVPNTGLENWINRNRPDQEPEI